jgi:hypothetical protein
LGEEEEEEGEGRIGVQILMVVSAEQVASCLRVRASVCQPSPSHPLFLLKFGTATIEN